MDFVFHNQKKKEKNGQKTLEMFKKCSKKGGSEELFVRSWFTDIGTGVRWRIGCACGWKRILEDKTCGSLVERWNFIIFGCSQ